MDQELKSKVAFRLYIIVLMVTVPFIAISTHSYVTKNTNSLPLIIIFTIITLSLFLLLSSIQIKIINNELNYKSLFRSFNINISELSSFGVKTIYLRQLPTGKPIFIYKTKNEEEFTLPVNMFNENSFKKISKYLILNNITAFHDSKTLSKRMVKRYLE